MINVANVVTLGRVGLALLTLGLLWLPGEPIRWLAFVLTILVIYGDALDGYLARKFKQSSKFGGMLDIAGDRVVEMAYWIVFASLSWVPAWVPLLFLVRGNFVDTIRALAAEQGYTAFGESTMMKGGVGRFLVTSNFTRFSYAVAKAAAFCLIIAAHTKVCEHSAVPFIAMFFVYFASFFCIIRGIPVLIEGRHLLGK